MLKMNSTYTKLVKLFGGVASAQAIVFAATPFLAKLYGPENFGIFGTFFTIASLLAIVFSLRLDLVISKAQNPSEVEQALTLFTSGLVFFIPFSLFCAFLYSATVLTLPFQMIIFSVMGGVILAFFNLSYAFLVYQEQYSKIAKQKIYRALITVLLQFIFVLFLDEGMLIGTLVSYLLTGLIFWNIRPYFQPKQFLKINLLSNYNTHKEIMKFNTLSDVINFISQQLPMLIAIGLGSGIVAPYFLAERLVRTPVYLLAQTARPLIIRKLVAAKSDIVEVYFKIVIKLVCLSCGLSLVAYGAIFTFFKNFDISGWQSLDFYLYLISVWAISSLVNTATTPFLTIINRSSVLFKLESVGLALKLISVGLYFLFAFTFKDFLVYFSIFSVFWYFVIFLVCLSLGKNIQQAKKELRA